MVCKEIFLSIYKQCVIGRLEQRERKNELVNDIDKVSFFGCYTSERCTLSEDNDANTILIQLYWVALWINRIMYFRTII